MDIWWQLTFFLQNLIFYQFSDSFTEPDTSNIISHFWTKVICYSRLLKLSAARGFGTRFSQVGPTMV